VTRADDAAKVVDRALAQQGLTIAQAADRAERHARHPRGNSAADDRALPQRAPERARRSTNGHRKDGLAAKSPIVVGHPLDEIETFLARFVAYPSEAERVAHVLWIGHAHLMEAWFSTARIAFLSPEPASGKTRALEVTAPLVPNPVQAVNVSAAYLFRKVADESGRPTVLFDECDAVFGPRPRDTSEEIRGLLNAGHRRGATAGRCVVIGKTVKTEDLPAYCAVALAGLGDLPDTILSRCVVVRMRRRAPNETVEPFRQREHELEAQPLNERLQAWATTVATAAAAARPAMPEGLVDRDADVWEPLLVVADLAGGFWPSRARAAASCLVANDKVSSPSLGVRLLEDLRLAFGERDRMPTAGILQRLKEIEEAPWAEIGREGLTARGLAEQLKNYGIRPKTMRLAGGPIKGYERIEFFDAWRRYLPAEGPASPESVTAVTPPSAAADKGTEEPGVTDRSVTPAAIVEVPPPDVAQVTAVTDSRERRPAGKRASRKGAHP
jgi:hypothetical protein